MAISQTVILGILTLGSLLMVAEAVIPGASFIVVGITLFMTGIIAAMFPIPNLIWLLPIAIIVGSISIYAYKNLNIYGQEIDRTTDGDDLRFKEGYVIDKVTETSGRVKLKNTSSMSNIFQARCRSGEISEDTEITVTDSGGGSVLEVIPLNESEIDDMYRSDKDISYEQDI